MATFEQGFGAVEASAEAAAVEAAELTKTARKLLKAAQEGNIAHIRRQSEQLLASLAAVNDQVHQAVKSWPFAASEEPAYLTHRFGDELCGAAAATGLKVTPRDDVLVCSPSIIRVLADARAVRIDGKQRAGIRPSKLAADLRANQQVPHKGNPQRFLEALFNAFKIVAGRPEADSLFDAKRMVSLHDIYEVFTSLPGSRSQYSRTDFARDIYMLDTSGVKTTKSGARIRIHPPSTASRSGRGIFSFADRDGNLIEYYGVRFTEES